jgi:hypothetical protein
VRAWTRWVWPAAVSAIVAGWCFLGLHWSETAWDFTMFYVAAHTPIGAIHDQGVFQETARRVLAGTGVTYASPYVRPAVFALALRWMRGLPYWEAYRIWAGLQFVFYGITLWILSRRFRVRVAGYYPWALFFPAFFGIITGQDSLALGLVCCLALVLLAGGSEEAGGAVLSLTLYKFNLFLLLPAYLVLKRRYRALAAYVICGAALAGVSALLEPLSLHLALLPNIGRYTIGSSARIMLGVRGLCANLGWEAVYPFAALGCPIGVLVLSHRMEFVRGFGFVVMGSLLCAYHGAWYDGAVLALPFGLALSGGGPALRTAAVCVMVFPFWNAFPMPVSVLLLGFAGLYSADRRWLELKTDKEVDIPTSAAKVGER